MTDPQPGQIHVDFEDVLVRFSAENSALLRRAVIAEAQVGALQQQVALQRQMIEGAPSTEEAPGQS